MAETPVAAGRVTKCTKRMDRKVFEFGMEYSGGPGPAAYGVKTTVGRTNRMPNVRNGPAYSMEHRPVDYGTAYDSPGPAYDVRRLTRRGKADEPKFSMGLKRAEKSETDGPGPAAYKPDVARKNTLKILLPFNESDPRRDNPGSNVYVLPSTLSKKGATMAVRTDVEPEPDSPGPAIYHTAPLNKYKNNAPKFTLGKRFEDPIVANEMGNPAPGPQSYHPTVNNKYKRMPKFSFGVRRPDKFPPFVVCADDAYEN